MNLDQSNKEGKAGASTRQSLQKASSQLRIEAKRTAPSGLLTEMMGEVVGIPAFLSKIQST